MDRALQIAAAAQPQDDGSEAKNHFLKGKTLEEMGEHAKAIEELEVSYALSPQPVVLFNLGVIHDKLGDAAAALTCYVRYLDESESLPQETADKLEKRIKKLREQVAVLALSVDQEGAEVLVDGKPAGLTPAPEIFLDLGSHELEIRKEGFETVKETVKALSFGKMELSFALKISPIKISVLPEDAPVAVEGGETRRKLVLSAEILIGIGGGFLLTAVVLGPLTDFHKRGGAGFTVFPFVARGTAGAGLSVAF